MSHINGARLLDSSDAENSPSEPEANFMGASQTTGVVSSEVRGRNHSSVAARYTSRSRHETDAPHSLVPPSRLRAARGKYLLSLDRSMKVFLRASNLPGLEYRLKLAGYRTLTDLLNTDQEELEARGFTGIMAQRLMNAVSEYVNKQLYRSEEERLPFRLVRKGQRLQTEPSESMKDNPNFRKRNLKRQKSTEGPVKKGQSVANIVRREMSAVTKIPTGQTPSAVRLMTEEDLQLQHLLSTPPAETTGEPTEEPQQDDGQGMLSVVVEEVPPLEDDSQGMLGDVVEEAPPLEDDSQGMLGDVVEEAPPLEDDSQGMLGDVVEEAPPLEDDSLGMLGDVVEEAPLLEEPPLLEESPLLGVEALNMPLEGGLSLDVIQEELEETESPINLAFGPTISRSFSVPADFKLTLDDAAASTSDDYAVSHIRTYSCPPSLAPQLTQQSHACVATLIQVLQSTCDTNELYSVLCALLRQCRRKQNVVEAASKGALVAVVKILQKHVEVLKFAEVCCRLLQHLCRTVTKEVAADRGSSSSECVEVPRESLSAVCRALDWHPTSRTLLTQALLAAASLCAADVYQCQAMLCEGWLESVGRTMEILHDDAIVQAAGIAALTTALAHVPDGRLPLLLEHGHLLDLVLHTMNSYSQDGRLQHYSVSFLALLVSVVATQIEIGVMQVIVERVAVTMEAMSHDYHVTYWGCKVFAHAASNAVLQEWKLASRCCDLLTEAMRTFPQELAVLRWAAHALCKLAASHMSRVCDHVLTSNLPILLDHPPPDLTPETDKHLHHLRRLLGEHKRGRRRQN